MKIIWNWLLVLKKLELKKIVIRWNNIKFVYNKYEMLNLKEIKV